MIISTDILRDFKQGNLDGFYDSVYPSLVAYAIRCLGTQHDYLAEDITQDAIFKVYLERDRFSDTSSFKSFLYTVVHNNAVSCLRKGQTHQTYMERHEDLTHDLQSTIIEHETIQLLYAAIDSLPDNLRQVFELSFEEGMTNKEIADRLNVSLGAIKKRKAKLIETIKKTMPDDPHSVKCLCLLLGIV